MCQVGDGEYPTFFNQTSIKASRSAHRCTECGRGIEVGSPYVRTEGLWDGEFQTFKTCEHCSALTRWFTVVCNGTLFGGLYEDLHHHWDDYRQPELGILKTMMLRSWRGVTPSTISGLVERNELYRESLAA
jgi:hypothetical protein